jgi:hypothetical protein
MSESVDILIKAEDLATPVIKQSAKAVDGLDAGLKRIKESGGQAKKSADFARIIASSLGGSEIGSYIAQMGEAADKTAQFSEIQKAGGAGALAFKAGLIGVAGVIGFQVGSAIGNVIFETERWNKELDKSVQKSDKLFASLVELKSFKFARQQEEISLIRDPAEQVAATKAALASIADEIEDKQKIINDILKKEAKLRSVEDDDFTSMLGLNKERTAEVEKQVQEQEKLIEQLVQQQTQIQRNTDETAQELRLKKEQNAEAEKQEQLTQQLQDKSASYVDTLRKQLDVLKATNEEKAGVVAAQNTVAKDAGAATQLLKEIDLINEKAAADKIAADEKKRTDTDNENNAKRLKALKDNELNKLAEERILLDKGREAANAFALEKQGLAKEDAAAIAREREQIDLRKDAINEAEKQGKAKPLAQQATVNTAFESRLLTRGPADDAAKFTAQNTANALAELKMMNLRQERMEKEANRQKGRTTTLTVVK